MKMPNQKGSLKDRLRSWNLFLRYKLKMLKKKQEEKKRKRKLKHELEKRVQISASGKYYSKPKIIGLTITGLFFGLFESKKNKHDKIKELEDKINLLEQKRGQLSLSEIVDIKNDIKVKIIVLKLENRFDDNIQSKLELCENRLEEVKEEDLKENPVYNHSNNIKIKSYKTGRKGIYTPVLEVKTINNELKNNKKKLKEIKEKVYNITEYNRLYELEYSLKQIKMRCNSLLNKYSNLKDLPGFYNLENIMDIDDIDIFNLRFNDNAIEQQIKECINCLDNIEKRRFEMLSIKKEDKQETKKEEQKKESKKDKENKKEKKKVEKKILEVELANKIVLDRLASERRNVEKFKRSISKMGVKKKKRSIFYYTKNILSTVVNFGLSLFPISLFKNKFIGGLASGIMVNNSLRSVRSILTPNIEAVYILYSDFEKELNTTSDYLNSINYICNDSLNQINDIRDTIYMIYGNDLEYNEFLEDYLRELDNVESQVLREQQMIINLQQEVNVTKQRNKQKIKEIRW